MKQLSILTLWTPHVYFKSPPTKHNSSRVRHPSKPYCLAKDDISYEDSNSTIGTQFAGSTEVYWAL